MGFFSWKTSDFKRSISNVHSDRGALPVHMVTFDGRIFSEPEYNGYGVFGGMDIYDLVGILNPELGLGTREDVIKFLFQTIVTDGEIEYIAGGVDFFNWEEPLHEGMSANALLENGWETKHPYGYGNFSVAAAMGIRLPKLVEQLPDVEPGSEAWAKWWAELPYPDNCPDQGYFY